MSIIDDFKKIKSDKKELRKFGITVGIIVGILGTYVFLRHRPNYLILWIISAGCLVPAFVFPAVLWPFHKIWISLSIVLGFIMTRVILSILFYVIMTPLSLISRLFGKDYLDCKWNPQAESYWNIREERKKETSGYENQY
ncbi:hypothetical protein JW948_18220 [bacterium]|nr:hypothetical protein [bacterium]